MSAEFFVDVVVRAFVEKIDIHLAEHWPERVGIALAPLGAFMVGEFERITCASLESFDFPFEQPFLI